MIVVAAKWKAQAPFVKHVSSRAVLAFLDVFHVIHALYSDVDNVYSERTGERAFRFLFSAHGMPSSL